MSEVNWVKGYENLYEIRVDGSVLRYYKSGNVKQLKPAQNSSGYLIVVLSKNSKTKTFLLHRLVAETFIPNPDVLPVVDHIDEDKTNNTVSNLRWCSYKQNSNFYCTKDGRGHQIKLARKRKSQLLAYEKSLIEARKQLKKEKAELDRVRRSIEKSKDDLKAYKEELSRIKTAIDRYAEESATKEKYTGYMDTSGMKFISAENYAEVTGKPIKVNGESFDSCGSAAAFIVGEELKSGNVKSKATISKELRRFLQGRRPSWSMYGKYKIS